MRFPKGIVIALFGASGTGKTATAARLSEFFSVPRRSCGNEVEHLAEMLGFTIKDLPDERHVQVDDETRAWVAQQETGIVEGRYLDQVLAPLPAHVVLVRLLATEAVRLSRVSQQPPGMSPPARDQADLVFRARLYKNAAAGAVKFELDTSNITVEVCAKTLILYANRAMPLQG